MITIDRLKTELSYDPDSGALTRIATGQLVYFERTKNGPRIEVAGKKMYARKVVLAFILGRYPEKHEYRHISNDPMDLRAIVFKRRRGDGRKDCALCGKDVPLDHYHRNPQRKDLRGSYCVDCTRQLMRKYNRAATVSQYGLTEQQFEDMAAAQEYKCQICFRSDSQERYNKLTIDHCHETGKVRGLLCLRCNTALGKFGDDPRRLLRAAQYLLGKL
jgi:hypothetical protein